MECKYEFKNLKSKNGYGINRYIVECKSATGYNFDKWTKGINRYIVECKYKN